MQSNIATTTACPLLHCCQMLTGPLFVMLTPHLCTAVSSFAQAGFSRTNEALKPANPSQPLSSGQSKGMLLAVSADSSNTSLQPNVWTCNIN